MYVLIMIFTFTNGGHGLATSTIQQEFTSEVSCKKALQTIQLSMQGPGITLRQASCLPK
jgi:hypothetical protein